MGEKLKDKVTLITGGGRGLGRQFALAYAGEGADIAIADWREMDAVTGEIKALNRRALAIPTDVRSEEQVNQMVQHTIEEFGKIDTLVTCAGGGMGMQPGPIWEQSLQQWQISLDVNLTGVFLSIKSVVPQMMKQKGGSIITISSWTGQLGLRPTGFGAYSIVKFGIEGLTHLAAAELEPYNIRVNALRPGGPAATPDVMAFIGSSGELTAEQLSILKELRHGPVLHPNIIHPLAIYLASNDSVSVTGQSFECRSWNKEHGFGDESQYYWSPEDGW